MNYQAIYLLSLTFIGIVGISIYVSLKNKFINHQVRMKKNRFDRLIDFVKRHMEEKEIAPFLVKAGITISISQLQLIRYTLILIWFMLVLIISYIHVQSYFFSQFMLIVLTFILSSPQQEILGKKTPFHYLLKYLIHKNTLKNNVEIYRALNQLKNIAIAKRHNPPGADFILEQIRKFTKRSRPIFNRMMALWSMGKKEQACAYLEQAINTKEAIELANLLIKLDDLNPIELKNQLILLQENIKKERETARLKRNENKSNVVYLFVIASSIVVMVNFIVVVYFIETIHQLKFIN